MNEDDCFQRSRLRWNMLSKKPFRFHFWMYVFVKVIKCVFDSGIRFLKSVEEGVREFLFCLPLHRWAGVFRKDAFCFWDDRFPHCDFHFRGEQPVGNGWVDCRCWILSGRPLDWRATGIWLKRGFQISFRFLRRLGSIFNSTESRYKR